jgi:RHS repeat-associated protein
VIASPLSGFTTSLTYDFGGRKTAMSDPDMGSWAYVYDALGQLLSQTDARGCTISFAYDALGRPLTKSVENDAACGVDANSAVTFYYDDYTDSPFFNGYNGSTDNAIGLRTGMDDESGYTWWSYDERGRVITETKVIDGYAAPFVTTFTYNNGDQPVSMTYPSGEVVTMSYLPQGLPAALTGDDAYLTGSTYDENGRLLQRLLNSAAEITVDYRYWNWDEVNGVGRLMEIEANGPSGLLQYFFYGDESEGTPGYDENGNIIRIENLGMGDIQTYAYDDLDRLTGWILTNQSATLADETYNYDDYGRLAGLPDPGSYDYPSVADAQSHTHPFHAVLGTASGNGYEYDENGSMIARMALENSVPVTYTFGLNVDNKIAEVDKDSGSGSDDHFDFVYDGDGNRVKAIDQAAGDETYYVGSHFEVTVEGGSSPVDPVCHASLGLSIPNNNETGVSDTITISGTSSTISDLDIYLDVDHTKVGELIVILKHVDTSTTITLLERPGYPPTSGMCTGDNIDGTFDDEAGSAAETSCGTGNPALSGTFQPYAALSGFDGQSLNGQWQIKVADRAGGEFTGTLQGWCVDASGPTAFGEQSNEVASHQPPAVSWIPTAGLMQNLAIHFAQALLRAGSATDAAQTAIGQMHDYLHFSESPGTGETWTSYYYAGGQRIAMRVQDPASQTDTDSVYYPLTDHLGSTSVTAYDDGTYFSELRYKPWGEERYANGVTPTDFTYTGQRSHESDFGLLFYNARWYDSSLGRFTSADTIIPSHWNSSSWDRYSYSLNNPCRYSDPSGYSPCEGKPDWSQLPEPEPGMKWRYVGRFNASQYIYADEGDYGGSSIPITVDDQTVNVREGALSSLDGIFMQGTLRLLNGRDIHPGPGCQEHVRYAIDGVPVVWVNQVVEGLNIVGWVPEELWQKYQLAVNKAQVRQRLALRISAQVRPWGDASFIGYEDVQYRFGPGRPLTAYQDMATDPRLIPAGSTIYIPSLDLTLTAADTGGMIRGNRIDVFVGIGYAAVQTWYDYSGGKTRCLDVFEQVPIRQPPYE